jgi:hypothetical protein
MTGILKNNIRLVFRPAATLTLVLLAATYGQSSAQATELLGMQGPSVGSEGPTVGQHVLTPGGLAVVTGGLGSTETITLPGAGTGFLENNGNGTSTLMVPGGPPQVLPTPR